MQPANPPLLFNICYYVVTFTLCDMYYISTESFKCVRYHDTLSLFQHTALKNKDKLSHNHCAMVTPKKINSDFPVSPNTPNA